MIERDIRREVPSGEKTICPEERIHVLRELNAWLRERQIDYAIPANFASDYSRGRDDAFTYLLLHIKEMMGE